MVLSASNELEVAVRGEWQDGVDVCLDTVGLGSGALVCVRDGGAFVTSVPTAVPDAARDIAAADRAGAAGRRRSGRVGA